MIARRVFVDTNVLYPIALADLYLSAAEVGLFEILYSDLLDELYCFAAMTSSASRAQSPQM